MATCNPTEAFQKELRSGQLQGLFEHLPGVYFVVKNLQGEVVMANHFAANACGLNSTKAMLGKTDFDLFTRERAESYVKDDQQVFTTGTPIIDRVELAPDPNHAIHWFVTTKLPLYGHDGRIIGLACIGRDPSQAHEHLRPHLEMNPVLEYVRRHYAEPLRIADLAKLVNLSPSQFQRRFKRVFGITPAQHLCNVRVRSACHLLMQTHRTIASIALDVGFYDHSHLVRSFRKTLSTTPAAYRSSASTTFKTVTNNRG